MAKFGQRVPAKHVIKSPYGRAFKEAATGAIAKAGERGHDLPPPGEWEYDSKDVGRYAALCKTCGMGVIFDYNNKKPAARGMALDMNCPGRPWLDG